MIDIYSIPVNLLDNVWHELEPLIKKGLEYANGEMGTDDIYDQIRAHKVIPVVMAKENKIVACVTLEVVQKPKKKIMTLVTAGGSQMADWLGEFMKIADMLAKDQDCESIYVAGRPGWAKKLRPYGYNVGYTVLTRQL